MYVFCGSGCQLPETQVNEAAGNLKRKFWLTEGVSGQDRSCGELCLSRHLGVTFLQLMREAMLHEYIDIYSPLFNMAVVLVAGIVGGELFARMKLPKVTGWIVTGIILRWFDLPGLTADPSLHPNLDYFSENGVQIIPTLNSYAPFNFFVLGYIAFTVGATLHIASLRNTEKRIGLLLLAEATITPLIVGSIMVLCGMVMGLDRVPAILLAAIAIAGAPGTTVLVVQEARARGILTRTLIAAIGLIDVVAVAIFVLVATLYAPGQQGLSGSLMQLGEQLSVTLTIGFVTSGIVLLLTRTVVGPAFLGPTMVAVILCSWGAGYAYGISGGILACTFAGIAVTNLRHDTVRSAEAYLHSIGGVLFALFFTFAGMKLDFTKVPAAAGLVTVYFFARLLGKYVGAFGAMSLAGVTKPVRNFLGFALLPHGGVAVGLIIFVQDRFPDEVSGPVATIGLAALAINQLLGPSAARKALQKAGEDHMDRPRLLDFLDEQRIIVGLTGSDRTNIIEQLTEQLYATTQMEVEKEEFLKLVAEREETITTCVGEGLMIPHAILNEGEEIRGILGISSKGLHLDAPDGRPVHAVLLLATPDSDRKRHLEVLAAFAKAITTDINIREQLYHARSAAHAYNILHADDAEEINYFLEDALEQVAEKKE